MVLTATPSRLLLTGANERQAVSYASRSSALLDLPRLTASWVTGVGVGRDEPFAMSGRENRVFSVNLKAIWTLRRCLRHLHFTMVALDFLRLRFSEEHFTGLGPECAIYQLMLKAVTYSN